MGSKGTVHELMKAIQEIGDVPPLEAFDRHLGDRHVEAAKPINQLFAGLSKEFEILIEIFKNGVVNKAVCLFSLGFVGKHVPTNLT